MLDTIVILITTSTNDTIKTVCVQLWVKLASKTKNRWKLLQLLYILNFLVSDKLR